MLLATVKKTNKPGRAGFWERFSKYGSVEDAFKHRGEAIVKFMDDAKSKK